jgi:cell wall-associated NlpC family hydrolase
VTAWEAQRQTVAREALTWVGTPYHHHGRVKGVGVDCAQILAAVYEDAGVIPHTELGNYPREWHLHHDEERYTGWLKKAGGTQVEGDVLQGDIAVFRFGRTFSHGAIVVSAGAGRPLLVHAYLARGVVTNFIDEEPLAGRVVQFWRIIHGR